MHWLTVNVEVDAALAEPLSEALLEAGAQSVAIDRPEAHRPSVHALLALQTDVAALLEATDVDPQAIETTTQNAAVNGVGVRAMLPDVLPPASYDLVISNILAQPLIVLAPRLAARAGRGGRIALSGVLESQAREVAGAYAPWADMRIAEVEEGWALLTGKRL